MVQLSHPYMTTGKTIALTRQTFVGKVLSLLFNMLFMLVITLRSKCPLISWLQSPSAVILEPPKIKFLTVSIVSPSICHEVMGPDAMILVFWMLSFKSTFSLSSVKRLPPAQETRVRSPGWEDPLEKEMATHSSTLAWKIPWTEEPGRGPRGHKELDMTERLHFLSLSRGSLVLLHFLP